MLNTLFLNQDKQQNNKTIFNYSNIKLLRPY